jgi:hypothetical protein
LDRILAIRSVTSVVSDRRASRIAARSALVGWPLAIGVLSRIAPQQALWEALSPGLPSASMRLSVGVPAVSAHDNHWLAVADDAYD